MKLNNYNNLLELFLSKYQSEDKNEIFLQSLKDKNLKFSWKHDIVSVFKKFYLIIFNKYIFLKIVVC